MASVIPAFAKNWQIAGNLICAADADFTIQGNALLFEIKQRMRALGSGWKDTAGNAVASPTGGATVIASSDGSTAGHDGVDRWVTAANLIHATPGNAHAWIVLQFSGIVGTYHVLLDWNTGGVHTGTVRVSHSGFGTAYGGTNGTTTAAPTALNSQPLVFQDFFGPAGVAAVRTVLNCWLAADASAFRIAAYRNGHSVILANFELLASPEPGWATPYYSRWAGQSGGAPSAEAMTVPNDFSSSLTTIKSYGSAAMNLFHVTEAGRSGFTQLWESETQPNSFSGNYQFWGIGVYSVTSANSGRIGLLADYYVGLNTFVTGDSYPNAAPFDQLVHVCGPYIWPWQREVPIIT